MDKNRELHELLGHTTHIYAIGDDRELSRCSCGLKGYAVREICAKSTPDYASDPRLVLREMMKREDFDRFVGFVNGCNGYALDLIPVDIILNTTGKLRDMTIERLKGGYGG